MSQQKNVPVERRGAALRLERPSYHRLAVSNGVDSQRISFALVEHTDVQVSDLRDIRHAPVGEHDHLGGIDLGDSLRRERPRREPQGHAQSQGQG